MPTPYSTVAAVAAEIAGIDPASDNEVERFYAEIVPTYSADRRELLLDWLAATVAVPEPAEIADLVRAFRPDGAHRPAGTAESSRTPVHRVRRYRRTPVAADHVLEGTVVSTNDLIKTIVVRVERPFTHGAMRKVIRRTHRYTVANEIGPVSVGQRVWIKKKNAYSKTDDWRVIEIAGEAETKRARA